jgi:hypothetical protein
LLAYLFWHRPRPDVEAGEYEEAQRRFHERLEVPSACFRLEELPFQPGSMPGAEAAYEDWYLIENWEQLGELNAAAVDAKRRGDHDRAASLAGNGWGAVYAHMRGDLVIPAAVRWQSKPRGEPVDALLDGVPAETPVWQRQLVLGPAPELCIGEGTSTRSSVVPFAPHT